MLLSAVARCGVVFLFPVFQQVAYFGEQQLFFCGLWLGSGGSLAFLLFLCHAGKFVYGFNEHEYTESYDYEIDGGLYEIAVVYGGGLQFLHAHVNRGECELEVGEVYASDNPSYWRHYYVVYYRRHYFPECASDDYTDGHVDGISFYRECLEFVK